MKIFIAGFSLFLTLFAFGNTTSSFAEEPGTPPSSPNGEPTTAAEPPQRINAKSLNDGDDIGGIPERAPTSDTGAHPYSDDEMKQAEPGSNINKNMPVDQD